MALDNKGDSTFDYDDFRRRIFSETFTGQQSGPLELRLDLLESFMEGKLVDAAQYLKLDQKTFYGEFNKNAKAKMIKKVTGSGGPELLAGEAGRLIVIDLTDPVIDSDSACVLFDICLAIFLEKTTCGKVIALDEAHNVISSFNSMKSTANFSIVHLQGYGERQLHEQYPQGYSRAETQRGKNHRLYPGADHIAEISRLMLHDNRSRFRFA